MLLPLPNLDDRRWADLVEEGRSLVPLYAPEWTDHNIHDPGITMLELFAWITEMDLFQINQIPERHRLKFLALAGIRPEPPRPSRTVLRFRLASGGSPITLPATTECVANDPFGQATLFRTLHEVTLAPTQIAALQVYDGTGWTDVTTRWRRGEPIAPFGDDPHPGSAFYIGLDGAIPPDVQVSLLCTISTPWAGEVERMGLLEEAQARCMACRVSASLVRCDAGEQRPCEDCVALPPHHAARLVWEFLAGPDTWRRLQPEEQVADETRALTLDGRILVTLPAVPAHAQLGRNDADLYYLRCRLVAGAYDDAPRLLDLAMNGVVAEQAVPAGTLAWAIAPDAIIEGTAEPGATAHFGPRLDAQGQIARLTFDDQGTPAFRILAYQEVMGGAPGRLSIEAEGLGRGTGAPWQQVVLSQHPVQEAGIHLYTLQDDRWQEWTPRPDFDGSGRGDAHAVLDSTRGTVTFGNGDQGRVVPTEARIIARYNATRAEAGNLAAGTAMRLADTPHNHALLDGTGKPGFNTVIGQLAEVTNPVAATGGAAAETLDHAEGRAVEAINAVSRAVTLADYETLARRTPGVRLARVTVRANLYPNFGCLQAPGVITVIILPYLPRGRPQPSPGLRRAVAAYLNRWRIVGTRIEVIGPSYLEVAVQAQVQVVQGTSKADVQRRIVEALNAFFDPLQGGPDGTGWPFGRSVYRADVLQVIAETPGVDHVLSLDLLVNSGDPRCGNVCLGSIGLVAVGQHRIEVV